MKQDATFAGRVALVTGGAIVTIASVAGKDGPKDMSIYAASKAAVIGFTKSWAKELAPHGVRVNCVSPSLIESTGMKGEMPDWFTADSLSRIPMGRAARAEQVALAGAQWLWSPMWPMRRKLSEP